jgi:hypothetical protein
LDSVVEKLKDEKAVLKSKQFPFRFYSAYREVSSLSNVSREYQQKVLRALEIALFLSVKNLPKLDGRTAIIVDTSGSMHNSISKNSVVEYIDIATLMGSIARYVSDESLVVAFGTTAKVVPLSRDSGILKNMETIKNTDVGHATYVEEALKLLEKNDYVPDRILLFSDMQVYSEGYMSSVVESVNRYLAKNKTTKFYSFDLAGYGTAIQPAQKQRVFLFSGWSEKMLNYIDMVEKEDFRILEEIKKNY